jgi:pyrimidine-nucleoside phosphorylase
MVPQWIIEKKRDKKALSEEEIRFFINGYTAGTIPDYQMAAMAMAIYLNGMTFQETAVLTDVMLHSGDLVDTSSIKQYKVDKHSTGGIGDNTSLILAPLIACCGLAVPMISGRGLGITGGTLDKMDSIKGYRTTLTDQEFVSVVNQCGCSIIGQTGQLAPADKKLYALRDVTATVPSIPLITASIMCKKLAEGLNGLVLDVKWGIGAFMRTRKNAGILARNMVEVGTQMGKDMAALITDMNEPLGHCAGNALEVLESIECLRGKGAPDLMEVTLALCANMLLLAGRVETEEEGLELLKQHIDSGAGLEKFKEMVRLHGGDTSLIDHPERLPQARIKKEYPAPKAGYVAKVSADAVGRAVLVLGAGRTKTDDVIDYAVGVSGMAKVGDRVTAGQPLLIIHANDEGKLAEAEKLLAAAFVISDRSVRPTVRIQERILPHQKEAP